jgi:predicted transcriptional regulator
VIRYVMTNLLDKAIAKARELPDEDRDVVAVAVLTMADQGSPIAPMDEDTWAAIREGLDQARCGEFVPDEEIEALWKRYGLRESGVRRARND